MYGFRKVHPLAHSKTPYIILSENWGYISIYGPSVYSYGVWVEDTLLTPLSRLVLANNLLSWLINLVLNSKKYCGESGDYPVPTI